MKDLRTFFNWCIPRYLKASPCVGLKMPAYKSRDRVLTEDELRRVWIACEYMPEPFGKIVRLLILTGQRKGEIGALTWDYVKDNKILLPKTLTKNGREHEFPVGKMTMQAINSVPVGRGATYLFQGRNGQYNGWGKHFKELLKRSGTTGWTLHDLLRTFATNLAALNVPIHVTEKLLNHVSGTLGGIAGVYNRHSYWTEQVEAIQLWEKRLQEIAR